MVLEYQKVRGGKLDPVWVKALLRTTNSSETQAILRRRLVELFGQADAFGVEEHAASQIVPTSSSTQPAQTPNAAGAVYTRAQSALAATIRGGATQSTLARYYLKQGVVSSGEELSALLKCMLEPPSIVVRVNLSHPCADLVVSMLEQLTALRPLSWFPRNHVAWQLNRGHPQASHAATIIRQLSRRGQFVSFQSTSSLVVPLMLSVGPNDRVLDLCAAPGSKATQMADLMNFERERVCRRVPSNGFLWANDQDDRRCHALRKRICGRYSNVFVSQFNAASFMAHADSPVPFTRVLVDVSCSGDGHINRHNSPVDALMRWDPSFGLRNHARQVACLRNAVHLAGAGGYVLYSTCTLNPIENEAVVAAVLQECRDDVEVVDPPEAPNWPRFSSGLHSWQGPSSGMGCPSMQPPKEDVGLSRCRRIMPHLHNRMDPFFVALLKKRKWSGASLFLHGSAAARSPSYMLPHPLSTTNSAAAIDNQTKKNLQKVEFVPLDRPPLHRVLSRFGIDRSALEGMQFFVAPASAKWGLRDQVPPQFQSRRDSVLILHCASDSIHSALRETRVLPESDLWDPGMSVAVAAWAPVTCSSSTKGDHAAVEEWCLMASGAQLLRSVMTRGLLSIPLSAAESIISLRSVVAEKTFVASKMAAAQAKEPSSASEQLAPEHAAWIHQLRAMLGSAVEGSSGTVPAPFVALVSAGTTLGAESSLCALPLTASRDSSGATLVTSSLSEEERSDWRLVFSRMGSGQRAARDIQKSLSSEWLESVDPARGLQLSREKVFTL